MSIIEAAVSLFAPHTCLSCGAEEDRLVCEGCASSLPLIPSRCYRCGAATAGYATCRDCRAHTPLKQVLVYTHHDGLAKELVHRLKYERARAGAGEMAALMAGLLRHAPEDVVLAPVPTANGRVRQRGYDQTRLITRALARESGVPHAALLARSGQAHQVGANRTTRLRQLRDAFRTVHAEQIRGKHILLVDDVLTTGATLEGAARVLKQAGAEAVSAVVFTQA